jgi:hypothetical protein
MHVRERKWPARCDARCVKGSAEPIDVRDTFEWFDRFLERQSPAEHLVWEAALFKFDAKLPAVETWTGRAPRADGMPARVRGRLEVHRETREKAMERGIVICVFNREDVFRSVLQRPWALPRATRLVSRYMVGYQGSGAMEGS